MIFADFHPLFQIIEQCRELRSEDWGCGQTRCIATRIYKRDMRMLVLYRVAHKLVLRQQY